MSKENNITDFTSIEHKELAGFWRRVAASTVDNLLVWYGPMIGLGVIYLIVFFALGKSWSTADDTWMYGGVIFTSMLILSYAISLLLIIYNRLFLQSKKAQSWGKNFFGLYILSDENRHMTIGESIGRGATYFINMFILGIGNLIMLFRKDKKTLSDLIVNTSVYGLADRKYSTRATLFNSLYFCFFMIVFIAYMAFFLIMTMTGYRDALQESKSTADLKQRSAQQMSEGSPIDLTKPDGCYGVDVDYKGETTAYMEYSIDVKSHKLSYYSDHKVIAQEDFYPENFSYSIFIKNYTDWIKSEMVAAKQNPKDLGEINSYSVDEGYCKPVPITGGNS